MEKKGQYRSYLKAELQAAATYRALAEVERDPVRAEAFLKLAEAEMRHAARWAQKIGVDPDHLQPQGGSLTLFFLRWIAKAFGTSKVIPFLLMGERNGTDAYWQETESRDLAQEERGHARTLRTLGGHEGSIELVGADKRRYGSSSGSLRAAVLGVNDGLVSNFSLVMGVAGGTSDPKFVLLAGVAGLMAGAFSMAAGEYVSVRSQRDVYESRIRRERIELERWPEEEEDELALIYQAKGLSSEEARRIAKQLMAVPEVALDTMAREELGLDPSQLGSPRWASISSFLAFIGGAIVPVAPYIFGEGWRAFSLSASLSSVALLGVGGVVALMAGKNVAWGSTRMLLAGGAAAAVTYGVGRLIGISLP